MRHALIVHIEIVRQYFENGAEVFPTANEKLLMSIFPSDSITMEETTFRTELADITYINQNDLDGKWSEVYEQFKNFIPAEDLHVEKYNK